MESGVVLRWSVSANRTNQSHCSWRRRASSGPYFAGRLTDFDLPIQLHGTPFQRRVWAALADIPYGETVSYGELAAQIGQPTAARAVGLANGRNPVAVIVPCHRVVGSTGSLVGYGGGLDRKRYLLRLEQRRRPD
jgi:methylated-DNA-[protein]-cysteine S-methyltransferase